MINRQPKASRLRVYSRCTFEPLEGRAMLSSVATDNSSAFVVAAAVTHPSVAAVSPIDKATNVSPDTFIACDVNLVGAGEVVDGESLKKAGAVTLVRDSDGSFVPGQANTTGGGDAIVFTPSQPLDENTKYRFTVSALVKDTSGHAFTPFTSTFNTGVTPAAPPKDIRFDKIPLPTAQGLEYTSVAVGPDHRLYVADLTGYIVRYDILDNGEPGEAGISL